MYRETRLNMNIQNQHATMPKLTSWAKYLSPSCPKLGI